MTTHQKQEEGRRTTTKSERTSASSLTNATPEHKKIIDAEEYQQQSDDLRLAVEYHIGGSDHIPALLKRAKLEEQLAMISETTARVIRNLIIQAADARNIPVEIFYESGINLYLFFDKPEQPEENHGKN